MSRKILIIEGNSASTNRTMVADGYQTYSHEYAEVLKSLARDLEIFILNPAENNFLPHGLVLSDLDGSIITGSALNIYDGGPEIDRQIELARALFSADVPIFGSCWGLQVGTVAAGGTVRKNPKGREFVFGRRICLTAAGQHHPLYVGKPKIFDAITVHLDEVETLASGMTILASNDHSKIQAAEWLYPSKKAAFWGVQYHPEFDFLQISGILNRIKPQIIAEGFFQSQVQADAFHEDLLCLAAKESRFDLYWRYGIDAAMYQDKLRMAELSNWLSALSQVAA